MKIYIKMIICLYSGLGRQTPLKKILRIMYIFYSEREKFVVLM